MITVNFVCLGNICRSPMAEWIFRDMVEKEGLSASFSITSSGTSDWEEGSQMYPPAVRVLSKHGIEAKHVARQITLADIKNADFVLCMDSGNKFDVLRLTAGMYSEKIYKLCDFCTHPRDVADPWYTLDFERAYKDIFDGCRAFLEYLKSDRAEGFAYDRRHGL